MKLRIKGNSLRMRLTQSEVSQIKMGYPVKESTLFVGNSELTYSLEPSKKVQTLQAHFENQSLRVLVPEHQLNTWANSNEISLKTDADTRESHSLFILIEKDFYCLKPRVHEMEDESDMFPNPNAAHGSCG